MTRGILLVNLGTPASTTTADVRAYLKEFLSDPRVIDLPRPLREILLRTVILPFRPKRSAAAYASIWDAAGPGTGSPLLHYSGRLHDALTAALGGMPCELAMRYGEPGIDNALERLSEAGATEVLLIPLFPQHADSTRETAIEAVKAALHPDMRLTTLPPFFDRPDYLDAQAGLIRQHLPESWDLVLLSYHGLPERHLMTADPTDSHCLKVPDCCDQPSPAHATCYRHQVFVTSRGVMQRLDISPDRYRVSFQSRLGRLPWLTPYTDQVLESLPGEGVRDLVVACPAFVADNLETLEEIGIAGRELFLGQGGRSFHLVPCLNDEPDWVGVLADWCRDGAQTVAALSDTAR